MNVGTATAILRAKDGSVIKSVQITRGWFVPPPFLIDGEDCYQRTSDDGVADPLEFRKLSDIEVIRV